MLAGVLSRLQRKRILVAGDLMLDRYTVGSVRRISPEAPVSVLLVEREEDRPGGAGNAVVNLLALGQEVVLLGRVGNDSDGRRLALDLQDLGADLAGLVYQSEYRTPIKNRFIAANQQVLRVDNEAIEPLAAELEEQLIGRLPGLLDGVSAVSISDYGKGMLSLKLLRALIDLSIEREIPVIADPKGQDFRRYSKATCLKPNYSEAMHAAGLGSDVSLEVVAKALIERTSVQSLMITRSEKGISLFFASGECNDFPAKVREVRDVTGAGDTVLAVGAATLASGLPITCAADLANVAGGLAVQRFGCARISLSDLARELLREDPTQKVFGDDHLLALQQALAGSPYNLLRVQESNGLSASLVRKIKEASHRDLVLYVDGGRPESDFVTALASLADVDFILLRQESVSHLVSALPPCEQIFS